MHEEWKKNVFGVSVDRVSEKNILCSKRSWNRRNIGSVQTTKVPGMSGQQILCSIHRNTQPSELPQRIFDDKRGQPDCISLQNVPNVPCPICPCLRDTSHSVAFCRRLIPCIPWSHVILTCHVWPLGLGCPDLSVLSSSPAQPQALHRPWKWSLWLMASE